MCCRQIVAGVEQRQQREVEERNRELAEKVSKATCDQLIANVRQDMEVLKAHMPSKETEALEASLDSKYLNDRQQNLGIHFNSVGRSYCVHPVALQT